MAGRTERRGILIVGQAPSRSTEGRPALGGESGRRLAEVFGFRSVREFADAVNLFEHWPGKSRRKKGCRFPLREAKRRAPLLLELFEGYRVVVVLGKGPALALGLGDDLLSWCTVRGAWCVKLPHPSGCNLWWNDDRNRRRARSLARRVLARALPPPPRSGVRV